MFVKEVQAAVLDGRADIAVHSAKDLPSVTLDGPGAGRGARAGRPTGRAGRRHARRLAARRRVATGSARRRAQLATSCARPTFAELRGNIATRLTKAADPRRSWSLPSALERLGLADRIAEVLDIDVMVPQVGQGALAIECRADDDETRRCSPPSSTAVAPPPVDAERAFLAELGGDCDLPAGAHCHLPGVQDDDGLVLQGFLAGEGAATGRVVTHTASGDEPDSLGITVARHLRTALGPT